MEEKNKNTDKFEKQVLKQGNGTDGKSDYL